MLPWLSLAGIVAVGALPRWWALYQSPTPSYREAALVTQVVELARFGMLGTLELGRLPVHLVSLAAPQLAGYAALTGGWDRAPSALGAVRESALPLWVGVALLTFVLARRSGARPGFALLAVALLALCPTAISAGRVAAPENVAVLWGVAGLACTAGRRSTVRSAMCADLGAISCLSIAALSAPVAIALLPTALAYTARHRQQRRVALVGGSVLFVTGIGAAAALATAVPSSLTSNVPGLHPSWLGAGWLGPTWLGVDPVTLILVVAAVLVSMRVRRDRHLAAGVALVTPLALLFGAPTFTLALPIAAVLVVLTAQRLRPGPLVPALLTGALALGWLANYLALPAALAPPPTAQAATWLRTNTTTGQRVLSDRRTKVALVAGTDAWDSVRTVDSCRRHASLPMAVAAVSHCTRAGLWITDPRVHAGLPKHRELVTTFGRPGQRHRVEVLHTTPPSNHARHPSAAQPPPAQPH